MVNTDHYWVLTAAQKDIQNTDPKSPSWPTNSRPLRIASE